MRTKTSAIRGNRAEECGRNTQNTGKTHRRTAYETETIRPIGNHTESGPGRDMDGGAGAVGDGETAVPGAGGGVSAFGPLRGVPGGHSGVSAVSGNRHLFQRDPAYVWHPHPLERGHGHGVPCGGGRHGGGAGRRLSGTGAAAPCRPGGNGLRQADAGGGFAGSGCTSLAAAVPGMVFTAVCASFLYPVFRQAAAQGTRMACRHRTSGKGENQREHSGGKP